MGRGPGGGDIPATGDVPALAYSGRLRAHELSLDEARPALTRAETTVHFVDSDIRSPYYYERFLNGATIYPRNLCFVKPEGNPNSPAVITDPDADKEAKKPWKGIQLRGVVEDDYIYATLLSKHLIPFGYEKLHLVALPARLDGKGELRMLEREEDFAERGHFRSYDWFRAAQEKWDSLKKSTTAQTLVEWFNFQNKLANQIIDQRAKVLYTASGVHLSACVIDTQNMGLNVYGRPQQGFIVDVTTYGYGTDSLEESFYLCALLNSPATDDAIKAYQPRGKGNVGERHIHRTPFEACAIPPFDATSADHLELARLSREAHLIIEQLKVSGGLTGGVVSIRRKARAAAAAQIAAIDVLARRVLGMG